MLRCILLKLPGLAAISDVAASPCQGQLIRSLSPVRSISPIRKEFCEAKKCEKIRKRSLSFPSYKPKSYSDDSDIWKLRFSDGKDKKDHRIIQRRDLHGKSENATRKGVESKNPQNKYFSSDRTNSNNKDPIQTYTTTKTAKEEFEMYEVQDQYELEAAKPRTSQSELAFNVFEYIDQVNKDNSVIDYLQPNNLKPFGSTDNAYYPSIIVPQNNLSNFRGTVNKKDASKHKKMENYPEDTQKRAYSSCSLPILNKDPASVEHNVTESDDINGIEEHGQSVSKSRSLHQVDGKSRDDTYQTYDSPEDAFPSTVQKVNPSGPSHAKEVNRVIRSKSMMPWPSYSETIKELSSKNISQVLDSNHTTDQGKLLSNNLDVLGDECSQGVKSANKKAVKDEKNLSTKYHTFENGISNMQRRTLSTKPLLRNADKTKERVKGDSSTNRQKCFLLSKVRLKPPPCTPRPQYDCKKEDPCPPRADEGMIECGKKLPSLEAKPCPVSQPHIPDQSPKLKRLTFKFEDPPRICPCDYCECPPRADDSAPTKTKKLKKLVPADCDCIEPPPMVDVPLPRLKKICEPEEKCYPPRVCPELEPCVRADDNLLVCRKSLPVLKDSSCLCFEPFVPDKLPAMKRLKFDFKDYKSYTCKPPETICAPRSDEGMEIRRKRLPYLKATECACLEPPPMVDVKLKRLQKFCPEEIKKECPVETCEDIPRADDNLEIKKKRLPVIEPSSCVCISPEIPDKMPNMRRLKMEFQDPPRFCPCTVECECPPRSDDTAPVKTKKLKPYVSGECLCIEPPPMVDVPFARLTKRCIPEEKCYPKPECPPEEPCIRADEGIETCKKTLPKIESKPCPCVEKEWKDAPILKRFNLHAEDPPRIQKYECICDVDCPRADDNLVIQPKKLRAIKASDCPCIDTPMTDVKLRRLQCEDYPEECLTEDPCPDFPRADWGCWEYYTPVPETKSKCENKEPKKKSVAHNSRRKYNTDAKLSFQQNCDMEAQKINSFKSENMIDLLGTSSKSPQNNKFISTIELLEELENMTAGKTNMVVTQDNISKKIYDKKVLNIRPIQNYSKNNLQSINTRNLVTASPNMAKVPNTEKSKKSSKKKPEKPKMCQKDTRCPVFASKNCAPRLVESCNKDKLPVCCEKQSSPYPAFSELMDGDIEPFTKHIQWTANKGAQENKQEPSKPAATTKSKRHYSTASVPKNSKEKMQTAYQKPRSPICPLVSVSCSNFSTFVKNGSDSHKTKGSKKCRKIKLVNCPASRPGICKHQPPKVECEKVPPPYKSFSDCLDEDLAETLSECPIEVKKVEALQPRYMDPLDKPKLMESILPNIEKIDPTKEDECVRKKLCMESSGITQDCKTFGKHIKPMKASEHIKEPLSKDCKLIEQLKKAGNWPPKRDFCTFSCQNPLASKCQQRGICNGTFCRNFHSINCECHSRVPEGLYELQDQFCQSFNHNRVSFLNTGVDGFPKWQPLSDHCIYHKHLNCNCSCPRIHSVYKIDAKGKSTYSGSTTKSKLQSKKLFEKNKLLNLKPRYPILPEMNMASLPSHHLDRIDPLMEVEYTRSKFQLGKEGITQDCSTFGKTLKRSELITNQQICESKIVEEDNEYNDSKMCRKDQKKKQMFDLSKPKCNFSYDEELCSDETPGYTCCNKNKINEENNRCVVGNYSNVHITDDTPIRKTSSSKCPISNSRPYLKPGTKYKCVEQKDICLKSASKVSNCCSKVDLKDKGFVSKASCERTSSKNLSLWQKIVNYFKARPNCPAPDEWKKKALKDKAEKAAKAAGLVLCDPKDMPQNISTRGKLPKVITPVCPNLDTDDCISDDGIKHQSMKCGTSIKEECRSQKRMYSTSSVPLNRGQNRLLCSNDESFLYSSKLLDPRNNIQRLGSKRFYSKNTCYKGMDDVDECVEDKDNEKDLNVAKIHSSNNNDEETEILSDNSSDYTRDYICPGWKMDTIDDLDELFNSRYNVLQRKPNTSEIIFKNTTNQFVDTTEYFGRFSTFPEGYNEDLENQRTKELIDELDKLINRIESSKN